MEIVVGPNMQKVLSKLGIMESDLEERERKIKDLEIKKAENLSKLEKSGNEAIRIEQLAVRKKKELDKASGIKKRMIIDEIKRCKAEVDRRYQEQGLFNANLHKIAQAESKYRIVEILMVHAPGEEALEELAFELEDARDMQEATDTALDYLNNIEIRKSISDADMFDDESITAGKLFPDDELEEDTMKWLEELEDE